MKRIVTLVAVIALMALLGTLLCACVPKDFDKAKEKLEKKGYTVSTDFGENAHVWLSEKYGMEDMLTATKDNEWVQAFSFGSKEQAKDYYEKNEANWKLEKEEAKKSGSTFTYGKSGKWVYCGTKAGVRAFK